MHRTDEFEALSPLWFEGKRIRAWKDGDGRLYLGISSLLKVIGTNQDSRLLSCSSRVLHEDRYLNIARVGDLLGFIAQRHGSQRRRRSRSGGSRGQREIEEGWRERVREPGMVSLCEFLERERDRIRSSHLDARRSSPAPAERTTDLEEGELEPPNSNAPGAPREQSPGEEEMSAGDGGSNPRRKRPSPSEDEEHATDEDAFLGMERCTRRLRVRMAKLSSENEQLRGHVAQLEARCVALEGLEARYRTLERHSQLVDHFERSIRELRREEGSAT